MKVYGAYLKDENLLKKSSSGGFATAAAMQTLQNGGVAYGVVYENDYKHVKYERINWPENICNLQGSKYLKANPGGGVLRNIISDLQDGLNVTFIGLPCDIAFVKSKLCRSNIDISNLILIDLICNGPTIDAVQEQFIDFLERKYGSKIKSYSMRYKNPEWKPPYLYAEFENGKSYCERLYRSDFGIALSLMLREGCYKCQLRGENRQSDLTIGDFWGLKEGDADFNKMGVSVISTHSNKGEDFLHFIKGIKLFRANGEIAMLANPRYSTPSPMPEKHQKFVRDFENYGLHKAVMKSLSLKQKVAYYVRWFGKR